MEEEVSGRFYDGRLIVRLLSYLKPYKSSVAVAVVCMMVHAGAEVLGPLLTKLAIDRYLAPPPIPPLPGSTPTSLPTRSPDWGRSPSSTCSR